MTDLGLSSYESRAYQGLIESSPASAQELAEISDVPQGRIYDVLESLKTQGFVRVQTDASPKQYIAVEPEIAINRYVDRTIDELQSEIKEYELIAKELREALPSPSNEAERFKTTTIGEEESVRLLSERIHSAGDNILMMVNHRTPVFGIDKPHSDAISEFESALKRGVEISMLLKHSIVDAGQPMLIHRLFQHPFSTDNFAARTIDQLGETLYLIDSTDICIEITNPMNEPTMIGLVYIVDSALAARLETQFAGYWEQAKSIDQEAI